MAMPDLGKQVGPLPLGAWIVVVAGGLGIAYYTRKSGGGNTEPETVEDTSTDPGVGTGQVGGWTNTQPSTTTPAATTPTTNEEWGQQAINGMIALGYSPTLADSAIRKYLNAETLSVSEFTIIGLALARFGSPPSPLPPNGQTPPTTTPIPKPPSTVPKPTVPKPKPPPKKPTTTTKKYRYYTVKKGDNLWNISRKYYGTGVKWGTIYSANRKGKRRADGKTGMISSASLIQPGWSLLIP
jgi:LysM repeat protein